MEYKLGKIYSYENSLGKIVTEDEEYIFNENDLEMDDIKKGDVVQFRPEIINDINRAFFVSKPDNLLYKNEEGIKKVINNGN